jgi:hypothetical protein
MKNFTEEVGINGHLTIIKQFTDGEQEVVFDDHNIIVSGMGQGLAYLFNASGSQNILDYQIDRFQLGVSGLTANEVSSTYELSGPLSSLANYGTGSNLFIQNTDMITGLALNTGDNFYALIQPSKITKIGETSVRYTLVVDEEACNGLKAHQGEDANLSEVGIFFKNPAGRSKDASLLAAYRVFTPIFKTSDFSLIFRWTINF